MTEDLDYWRSLKHHEWTYTPPLSVFCVLQAEDPSLIWAMDRGHLVNLLEDAMAAFAGVAPLRQAIMGLLEMEQTIHRTHPNTAVHGGIGGQTLTPHCAWECMHPDHNRVKEQYTAALSEALTVLRGTEELEC